LSRIRTNALALAGSFFSTAFLAFLQVKIITNYLDRTEVGIWSTVIAVGALCATLSENGLPMVLVRFGAKYDAEGRLPRLFKLWWFAVRVFSVALLGVIGLLIVGGPGISRLLGGGEVDRWILVLGYVTVGSGSLRAFNNASFRGLRRMTAMAVLEISFAATVTVVLFLLRHRLTVPLVLSISLGSGLLWASIGIVILLRILRGLQVDADPARIAPPIRPEIRHYWQGAAAAGIFLVAIEQLDKPILATLVSFDRLALFHVAARLALFARRLIYVPFQVMNPEVTHKWESNRREELRHDMELFSKLTLGLGLSMAAGLAVFARPLLLLVSTPEFLAGAPVLWMFTAVLPLICLHQPMVMFLRATGRVWYAFIGDATWLVTYLGVGSLLVHRFGLAGFVFGQVVASSLILVYNLVIFHHLEFPRPPVAFFLKRLALGAVVWGAAAAAGHVLPMWPWWQLILLAVLIGIVGNFLMVRGRFLTPAEEKRTVHMLAGRGGLGRAAQFLLTWPRGIGAPGESR